ncbi:hypothetical protein [Natronobacterium gregoryi]|uniref:DUF8152 domain-containing protein n=2 Tax=Natronobacterium gregoryi TaxID=44930 RepID=L0AKW3_NATGS|nr:hypothetical protein [Natronobacterium gregoryi]AFZ74084.1 hypothetical protein Natgr_2947 [Natronobacterium gregoryi SP2]PLK18098.1 hypothetical protein CYV19_18690 [Natronobacterium gregoryi SP2]SFJ61765.1 hypothetical protein SAMN05443661_1475 [Natronobacterium gregoryi]
MTGDSADAHVSAIATHLEATAELPLERATSRLLGEAKAVARDAAADDLERDIRQDRVETVRELLAEIETVDHDEARKHVDAATDHCETLLSESS